MIKLFFYSKPNIIPTAEQGFVFTLRGVKFSYETREKPRHWQEGDTNGNFVWDPYYGINPHKDFQVMETRWITVTRSM